MYMSFDPAQFEAEVALKLVPTEQLPTVAQDAMEAGFDGPSVVRMAILDPRYGWAIDQALPPMLAELGLSSISADEAAMRLAEQRARHLLETSEDPLPSLPYFYQLMLAAEYSENRLFELAYLEDEFDFYTNENLEERRRLARKALENLLSPELAERRQAERKAAWDMARQREKSEWPYVLNSESGRGLLKERYIEKVTEMRPLLWIELVAWALLGWAFASWRKFVIGFSVTVPILFALPILGVYLAMKRERRNILLRRRVPEDEI